MSDFTALLRTVSRRSATQDERVLMAALLLDVADIIERLETTVEEAKKECRDLIREANVDGEAEYDEDGEYADDPDNEHENDPDSEHNDGIRYAANQVLNVLEKHLKG